RTIWTAQGSPLMHYTCALTEKIAARLNADYGERVVVKAAMRYGNPHFTEALSALHQQGVERLLVLPLFPQYSGSTTGSIYDCLGAQLRHWRYIPHVHVIGDYYVDDEYIAALAHSVKQRWERQGMRPSKLLFSFHGIPQRYVDKGDPYAKQCLATAEAVASALGLASDQWCTAFQSRFGREQWLKPYTSEVLTAWAKQGVESVSVICPGFAVDCLETIEEIGEENAHLFLSNGGKTFDYIPALNDDLTHVSALTNLVSRSINEW
ncbi:MAG: ferrochelatase, partial [Gammaproteobacteria bacterium]|nr:ferrochelatase [Gammaproteobacteria bacterium]